MPELKAHIAIAGLLSLLSVAAGAQNATNRLKLPADAGGTNGIAGLHVEPGLRVEVAAAEPMLSGPIAAAFDENGRAYVVEMRLNSGKNAGRIRLLEGLDSKGRFTTSTVFAENLDHASAVACYGGGVFVGAGKEILFLKDVDADGVSDIRKVIFTGLGGTNELGPGRSLNSFTWGLDNRLHIATAGIGGALAQPGSSEQPLAVEQGDFSFDPRTLVPRLEDGSADTGVSFDSFGRQFVCSYAHPISQCMAEYRYWSRNPFFPRANPLRDVISPATLAYKPGTNSVSVKGGTIASVAPSGWLKAAQGLAIYRGHLLTGFEGQAFLCDPDSHAVLRVTLSTNGFETVGFHAARQEFLASAEPSFRPVQALNGPDGAVYVLDSADGERGRLYRVVPENFARSDPVKLNGARTYDLVAALAQANGWTRDTASRLLYERQDPASVPLLSNVLSNSRFVAAKIHALHALAGSGLLTEAHVIKGCQDPDPFVRVHALRAAEALAGNGTLADPVLVQMKRLASDPSLLVRHQLALTVGLVARADKTLVLGPILMRDSGNLWMQSAVLSALSEGAGNLFLILAADGRFRSTPVGLAFLRNLATMIGTKGRMDETSQVIQFMSRSKMDAVQGFALLEALGEGLRRTRSSLALVDPQAALEGWYTTALAAAVDTSVAEPVRTAAVNLAGVSPYTYADTSDWLLLIANPQPFPSLRAAAISALNRYDDPHVLPALVERWNGFSPQLRRIACDGLLSRVNRISPFLDALERGAIPVRDLSATEMNLLRTCPDPGLRERAIRDLGPVPLRRPAVVEQYRSALALKGTWNRGSQLFAARCAECHQAGSSGARPAGPDLAGARVKGRERVLASILEPSAEINPGYQTVIVETQDGELAYGVRADETSLSLSLLGAGSRATVWPRVNIRSREIAPWSLMPDNLEQGLSAQDMADLLEFLMAMPGR